jgi:hypothetical protein
MHDYLLLLKVLKGESAPVLSHFHCQYLKNVPSLHPQLNPLSTGGKKLHKICENKSVLKLCQKNPSMRNCNIPGTSFPGYSAVFLFQG